MVDIKPNNIIMIIPSYNESKNISHVIEGIRREFPKVKIVIVDDSDKKENDATKKAVSRFKNIKLISRESKKGRGSAVIEGFGSALKHKEALYFFEMDADLSHESTHLKRFLASIIEKGVGMVIGSRYVKGGNSGKITLPRRILSKIINRFLSVMLEVKLFDYTSGFRLYSRKAVEFLVKADLKSTGFITLSEITYKLNKRGFKIREVPVTITKRKYGKSNMGIKELADSLFFILKIKIFAP